MSFVVSSAEISWRWSNSLRSGVDIANRLSNVNEPPTSAWEKEIRGGRWGGQHLVFHSCHTRTRSTTSTQSVVMLTKPRRLWMFNMAVETTLSAVFQSLVVVVPWQNGVQCWLHWETSPGLSIGPALFWLLLDLCLPPLQPASGTDAWGSAAARILVLACSKVGGKKIVPLSCQVRNST